MFDQHILQGIDRQAHEKGKQFREEHRPHFGVLQWSHQAVGNPQIIILSIQRDKRVLFDWAGRGAVQAAERRTVQSDSA
jgi:hypothetical protein